MVHLSAVFSKKAHAPAPFGPGALATHVTWAMLPGRRLRQAAVP
jgi:hypothetical protein